MNATPRLVAVLFGLAILLILEATAFADAGAQTKTHLGPPGAIIVGIICYLARKERIGGWLLYYYFTLYAGVVASFLLLAATFQNYSPERWQSTPLYVLAIASTTLDQLLLIGQVVVATVLLKWREWKFVKLLRAILIGSVIWAATSLALDYAFYSRENDFLDWLRLVSLAVWLAYFFISKRVKRVFLSKDWGTYLSSLPTKPAVPEATPPGIQAPSFTWKTEQPSSEPTTSGQEPLERTSNATVPANTSGNAAVKREHHPAAFSRSTNIKRTLWGAAIGALLAMLAVPCIAHGYEPIFSAAKYQINVAQLILNVSFAAILGAVASNLSRRAVLALLWVTGAVIFVSLFWIGFYAFQQEMKAEAEREQRLAYQALQNDSVELAKEHLLKAANYWQWKGWWEGARQTKERALDEQGLKKDAAAFQAQKNEARARQLLRGEGNIFDAIDLLPKNQYPSDYDVTQAKRLLIEAAEYWQLAGNSSEAQRVRGWGNKLKTAAEWKASFQLEEEEKLVHEPIKYDLGIWTTEKGQAFAYARFFERNLGDRKGDLDALADRLGAKTTYTLADKKKQGNMWWVSVWLYKR